MIFIKYLFYLYCQYKKNNDKYYFHYIRSFVLILGRPITEEIFSQLKIFLYKNTLIKKKDEVKDVNLNKSLVFKEFGIDCFNDKEFTFKLNFLKKISVFLKNRMVFEIFEDIKNFQKYFDYKNINYFILLFLFKSLESLFNNEFVFYYFTKRDSFDILIQLMNIENSNEEIEKLKDKYMKIKKCKLKSHIKPFNCIEIFSKENLLYIIYLLYHILTVDNNEINLHNILKGIDKIDFYFHILYLLHNLISKKFLNKEIDYNERIVCSVQIEHLSNKSFLIKKLNKIVKNIIFEILTIDEAYISKSGFYLEILRFNFKIDFFREIFCEKFMNNLNKIITSKLTKQIYLLFKDKKDKNTYQILSYFIKINEFKSLLNAEQTISIIYKFREKTKENAVEINNLNDLMLYIRCYFTFFTFLNNKLGKSRDYINQYLFHQKNKSENKKYTRICSLMEEFIFLFYIFNSLINCLLIQLIDYNKILIKNAEINLGIEFLINFMKLGFFYNIYNKDSDFIEIELILKSMNYFIHTNCLDIRLLNGFYIYSSLDEYLENRKLLIETINENIKKKTPIYFEKIHKIRLDKELIKNNNILKTTIKFITDYDLDYIEYLSNLENVLKVLPNKEYYKSIVKNSKKRFFNLLRKSDSMMKLIENYIDLDNILSNYKDNQIFIDRKKSKNENTQIKGSINNQEMIDQIQLDMFSTIRDKISKKFIKEEANYYEKDDSCFLILKDNKEIELSGITIDLNISENPNESKEIKNENLNYSFDNQSKYLSDNSIITDNLLEEKSKFTDISFFDFDFHEKNENSFRTILEKSRVDKVEINEYDKPYINQTLTTNFPTNDNNEKINVIFSFNNHDKINLKSSLTFTKKKYISIKFIFMILDKKIKKRIFKLIKKFKHQKKRVKESSLKLKEIKKSISLINKINK